MFKQTSIKIIARITLGFGIAFVLVMVFFLIFDDFQRKSLIKLSFPKAIINPNISLIKDAGRINIPDSFNHIYISSEEEFLSQLSNINRDQTQKKGNAFVFNDGSYTFTNTVVINSPNTIITSFSGNPKKVIINGNGMIKRTRVENIFEVHANGFILDSVTLQEAGNHLIQIRGEKGANFPIIRNCILQNSYEQLIKVTYDKKRDMTSKSGFIENCTLQYTAGIGPNFYIGGIDAHGIQNWVIKNNLFKYIASPADKVAEHAIHLWKDSINNSVQGNIIIDSDRGIGFGLGRDKNKDFSNYGGVIKDNYIYHSNNKNQYSDTGISLESSPYTLIKANYIFLEHDYPRSIEYRFAKTFDAKIISNFTNKSIQGMNGGNAVMHSNKTNLNKIDFLYLLNEKMKNIIK